MKDTKACSTKSGCCWNYKHEIVGAIFILIATLLTIFTVNSLGILGMFIVGAMLLCCKHSRCNCSCHCGCCNDLSTQHCDTKGTHEHEKAHKKPAASAKAKK